MSNEKRNVVVKVDRELWRLFVLSAKLDGKMIRDSVAELLQSHVDSDERLAMLIEHEVKK